MVKLHLQFTHQDLKKNIALAMVSVEQSEIGNEFQVTTNEGNFNCIVVEKPFYDPKKKDS